MADYGGGAPANTLNEGPRYRTKKITAQRKRRVLKDRPTPKSKRPKLGGGAPRSRRQEVDPFEQEVNTLADLMFGGQERELKYRRSQEQQFGTNQNSWYAKHIADMQKAQAFQAGVNQALTQQAYGAAQNAATTDINANNQQLQQAQQQAAKFGTTVDASVYQQANAGAAARQVMGNAGGNLLGQIGSAQSAYMGNQIVAGSEQGIQAQQDTQARQRRLDQLAADLAGDKGLFKYKARIEGQERQHKQALEDAAFGVSTQNTLADNARADKQLKQTTARNRLLNAQTRSQIRKTRGEAALDRNADLADDGKRNYSTDYGEWKQRTRPKNGAKPGEAKPKYTQSQRNDNQSSYRKARSIASGIQGKPSQVIAFLVNKKGIDPLIARAAAAPGTLTAKQRAELRRMGIKGRKQHTGSLTPRNPDGTPG